MQKHQKEREEAAANESRARKFVATSTRGCGTAKATAITNCGTANTHQERHCGFNPQSTDYNALNTGIAGQSRNDERIFMSMREILCCGLMFALSMSGFSQNRGKEFLTNK